MGYSFLLKNQICRYHTLPHRGLKICLNNDPMTMKFIHDFRSKQLCYSEWLEVYHIATKKTGRVYEYLIKSLQEKFQWVVKQAKKIGRDPPPELQLLVLTPAERKRKRTDDLRKMFPADDLLVDGSLRKITLPVGVEPKIDKVIREPEVGFFYLNGSTDLCFQRESEFHLTSTVQLIKLHPCIKLDSQEAKDMYALMSLTIEARDDLEEARKAVEKDTDLLGNIH
ncbi:hypothetical protein Tco_0912967 [Tanacetum coccineum]